MEGNELLIGISMITLMAANIFLFTTLLRERRENARLQAKAIDRAVDVQRFISKPWVRTEIVETDAGEKLLEYHPVPENMWDEA